jgi:hypothetical protein
MAMPKKSILIALLLIACLIAAGYGALSATLTWVKSLEPSVAGAFTTAFIGLLGLLYVQWQSKSRDIAESHRPSKVDIYNTFFGIVERLQDSDKSALSDGEVPDWMKAEFIKLNRGLILWASPGVIRAWLDFRTSAESGKNMLVAVDRMYQAIRKDLGNSNFGLRTGDLIKISLKDPNEWHS